MPSAVPLFPAVAWLAAALSVSASPAKDGTARNTSTGAVFERRIEAALNHAGYATSRQERVGNRPNGRPHFVDIVARKAGKNLIVSLKWQQAGGTAEQKIPYEIICLSEALLQSRGNPDPAARFDSAFLVLGGDGWTLKSWYLSGALEPHLPKATENVKILGESSFLEALQNAAP